MFQSLYKSRLRRNISWNTIGGSFGRLITPIFYLLVSRSLSPADYGYFALGLAIFYFYDTYKDLGFGDAVIAQRNSQNYTNSLISIQLLTAIVSFTLLLVILLLVMHDSVHWNLAFVILIMSVSFFVNAFTDPVIVHLRLTQDYRVLAARQIIAAFIGGASGLLLVNYGFGLYSLPFSFLISNIVSMLLILKLAGTAYEPVIVDLSPLRHTARNVVFQRLSGFLVFHADNMIINSFLGSAALGIYKVSQQLTNLIPNSTLLLANQVFFSEFSLRAKKNDYGYIEKIYTKYCLFSGATLLLFSVFIFYIFDDIIVYILGSQWSGVANIVTLLSCSLATAFMCLPNNDLSKIMGFTRVYTIFSIIRSVITLLAISFAAQFGLKITAIVWVLVAVIANITNEIIFLHLQKRVNLRGVKSWLYCINISWLAFVVFNEI